MDEQTAPTTEANATAPLATVRVEHTNLEPIPASGVPLQPVQHVRIGGSGGVRVHQTSIAAPTTVKRVTANNDATNAVNVSLDTLREVVRLAGNRSAELGEQITALLPPLE